MRKVSDSYTEQVHKLRYQYLNGRGRLFGGILMQWIDEVAGIVASRHCRSAVITAAVDNLSFKQPAFLQDLIILKGRITYAGTTSMEIRVDTFSEKPDGSVLMINQAYVVMVATDEAGRPIPVPPLELVNEEERDEWQRAEKRSQLRRQRRKEQF